MKCAENRILQFSAALLFFLFVAPDMPASDELWERTVELYRTNSEWKAGRIVTVMEELGSTGEPVSREETVFRAVRDENGERRLKVVYSEKNGKDVTELKKRDLIRAERAADGTAGGLEKLPFDPLEQQRVTVNPTGRSRSIDGVAAVGYRFEHEYDLSSSSHGIVWIDPATAAPLLLEATYDPLPPFTRDLEISISYRYEDPLTWYPVRIEVLVTAKLLFVTKSMRSISTLTDHLLPDLTGSLSGSP